MYSVAFVLSNTFTYPHNLPPVGEPCIIPLDFLSVYIHYVQLSVLSTILDLVVGCKANTGKGALAHDPDLSN